MSHRLVYDFRGEDADEVPFVGKGTVVTAIGAPEDGWIKVRDANGGVSGFVPASYLERSRSRLYPPPVALRGSETNRRSTAALQISRRRSKRGRSARDAFKRASQKDCLKSIHENTIIGIGAESASGL